MLSEGQLFPNNARNSESAIPGTTKGESILSPKTEALPLETQTRVTEADNIITKLKIASIINGGTDKKTVEQIRELQKKLDEARLSGNVQAALTAVDEVQQLKKVDKPETQLADKIAKALEKNEIPQAKVVDPKIAAAQQQILKREAAVTDEQQSTLREVEARLLNTAAVIDKLAGAENKPKSREKILAKSKKLLLIARVELGKKLQGWNRNQTLQYLSRFAADPDYEDLMHDAFPYLFDAPKPQVANESRPAVKIPKDDSETMLKSVAEVLQPQKIAGANESELRPEAKLKAEIVTRQIKENADAFYRSTDGIKYLRRNVEERFSAEITNMRPERISEIVEEEFAKAGYRKGEKIDSRASARLGLHVEATTEVLQQKLLRFNENRGIYLKQIIEDEGAESQDFDVTNLTPQQTEALESFYAKFAEGDTQAIETETKATLALRNHLLKQTMSRHLERRGAQAETALAELQQTDTREITVRMMDDGTSVLVFQGPAASDNLTKFDQPTRNGELLSPEEAGIKGVAYAPDGVIALHTESGTSAETHEKIHLQAELNRIQEQTTLRKQIANQVLRQVSFSDDNERTELARITENYLAALEHTKGDTTSEAFYKELFREVTSAEMAATLVTKLEQTIASESVRLSLAAYLKEKEDLKHIGYAEELGSRLATLDPMANIMLNDAGIVAREFDASNEEHLATLTLVRFLNQLKLENNQQDYARSIQQIGIRLSSLGKLNLRKVGLFIDNVNEEIATGYIHQLKNQVKSKFSADDISNLILRLKAGRSSSEEKTDPILRYIYSLGNSAAQKLPVVIEMLSKGQLPDASKLQAADIVAEPTLNGEILEEEPIDAVDYRTHFRERYGVYKYHETPHYWDPTVGKVIPFDRGAKVYPSIIPVTTSGHIPWSANKLGIPTIGGPVGAESTYHLWYKALAPVHNFFERIRTGVPILGRLATPFSALTSLSLPEEAFKIDKLVPWGFANHPYFEDFFKKIENKINANTFDLTKPDTLTKLGVYERITQVFFGTIRGVLAEKLRLSPNQADYIFKKVGGIEADLYNRQVYPYFNDFNKVDEYRNNEIFAQYLESIKNDWGLDLSPGGADHEVQLAINRLKVKENITSRAGTRISLEEGEVLKGTITDQTLADMLMFMNFDRDDKGQAKEHKMYEQLKMMGKEIMDIDYKALTAMRAPGGVSSRNRRYTMADLIQEIDEIDKITPANPREWNANQREFIMINGKKFDVEVARKFVEMFYVARTNMIMRLGIHHDDFNGRASDESLRLDFDNFDVVTNPATGRQEVVVNKRNIIMAPGGAPMAGPPIQTAAPQYQYLLPILTRLKTAGGGAPVDPSKLRYLYNKRENDKILVTNPVNNQIRTEIDVINPMSGKDFRRVFGKVDTVTIAGSTFNALTEVEPQGVIDALEDLMTGRHRGVDLFSRFVKVMNQNKHWIQYADAQKKIWQFWGHIEKVMRWGIMSAVVFSLLHGGFVVPIPLLYWGAGQSYILAPLLAKLTKDYAAKKSEAEALFTDMIFGKLHQFEELAKREVTSREYDALNAHFLAVRGQSVKKLGNVINKDFKWGEANISQDIIQSFINNAGILVGS